MVTITARLDEGTAVSITNGRHTWRADEPVEQQGTDSGPNPYELLLGALSGCICITLSLYSSYKGIALTSVTTTLHHDRVHADDCRECEDDLTGFIDRIESHVHVEGDLSAEERKRLTQIAQRCPVHKTLQHGVVLVDHVTFGRAG